MDEQTASNDWQARLAALIKCAQELKTVSPTPEAVAELAAVTEGLVAEVPGQRDLLARLGDAAASADKIVAHLSASRPDVDMALRTLGHLQMDTSVVVPMLLIPAFRGKAGADGSDLSAAMRATSQAMALQKQLLQLLRQDPLDIGGAKTTAANLSKTLAELAGYVRGSESTDRG